MLEHQNAHPETKNPKYMQAKEAMVLPMQITIGNVNSNLSTVSDFNCCISISSF